MVELLETLPCKICKRGRAVLIGCVTFKDGREEYFYKCQRCGKLFKWFWKRKKFKEGRGRR